jgi:O-antigen/teichoic acid export membrane protein
VSSLPARARSRIGSLFADRSFGEILSGSIYAVSGRGLAAGLGLLSSLIVARLYGAEVMGVLALIDSLLLMTVVVTGLGTTTSILRLIPEHTSKYSPTSAFRVYRKTEYLVTVTSAIAAGALFLASDALAARLFGRPDLAFLFALAAPFVVVKALVALNTHAVRGLVLIRTFGLMQALPVGGTLLVLAVATLAFDNRNIPVYAYLAGPAITAVASMWIVERTFRRRMGPTDVVHPTAIRSIVAVSVPMLMSMAMTSVIGDAAVILLGMYRTQAEVGYYAMAFKLAGLTGFLLMAINAIAAPKFSQLFHAGQTDEALRVARKSTRLIFWTTAPALLTLIVLGRPVLALLFGKEFTSAYLAMVILAVSQFMSSVSGSTAIFLNMTGQERILRNIMLAAAALSVVLNLALIPWFGIEGAAVARLVTVVCWNGCALRYIKVRFGRTIGYFPSFRMTPAEGGRQA